MRNLSSGNTSAKPLEFDREGAGLSVVRAFCRAQIRRARDRAQSKLAGNLPRDGQCVAGEHFHGHAQILKRVDKVFGVRPRRILKQGDADQLQRAVLLRLRHRQGPKSLPCLLVRAGFQGRQSRRVQSGGIRDRSQGALRDMKLPAVAFGDRFRPAGFRREWRERLDLFAAREQFARARGTQEGEIDGVVVGLAGGERAAQNDVFLGKAGPGQGGRKCQPVECQCPGLVGAKYVEIRRIFRGVQMGNQNPLAGKRQGAHGHAHREHHRQRHRDRAHQQHEREGQDVEKAQALGQGHDDGHGDQRADNEQKPAHDPAYDLLDMQLRLRAFHQLRGSAEVGARARGRDHGRGFAIAYGGARIQDVIIHLIDRTRFAGEGGLVNLQGSIDDLDIGRNEIPRADAYDVAADQAARGPGAPNSIAQNAGRDLQAMTQKFDRGRSVLLLQKAQHRIDDEQRQGHPEVRIFVKDEGKQGDQFDHPGRKTPEFSDEID